MNRTTEDECPDCSGFHRCDYHEGVRHGRQEAKTDIRSVIEEQIEEIQDRLDLSDQRSTVGDNLEQRKAELEKLVRDITNGSETAGDTAAD